MVRSVAAIAAALCAYTGSVAAQSPALPAAEAEALARNLRALLILNLPDPLVQSAPGWGQRKEVTVGVKFHRNGFKLTSVPQKAPLNDGVWRRMAVRTTEPTDTLALALAEVSSPEPGRVTFTAAIGVDCALTFEQQLWKGGVRLYSGETRGRCRGALLLQCEAVNRLEPRPGSFLPDAVFRLRVTEAHLSYDRLAIDHTAGVGGDAARLLGEALIHTVKQVKPSLERDLLAKANAAVVKAGDTRELRVDLGKLLEGKAPTVTKAK